MSFTSQLPNNKKEPLLRLFLCLNRTFLFCGFQIDIQRCIAHWEDFPCACRVCFFGNFPSNFRTSFNFDRSFFLAIQFDGSIGRVRINCERDRCFAKNALDFSNSVGLEDSDRTIAFIQNQVIDKRSRFNIFKEEDEVGGQMRQ